MNVLMLCTGNSCRSILAEATFNHLAPAGWRALSAGSKPAGYVHPRSLALLAREGAKRGFAVLVHGCTTEAARVPTQDVYAAVFGSLRSEERRVGKGGRSRCAAQC